MSDQAVSVHALNKYVHALLERDPRLQNLTLRGEISNWKGRNRTGHMYFALKEEFEGRTYAVNAVMFRGANQYLNFEPEEGMEVLVQCQVSLYEGTGGYQIIISAMQPAGEGELQKRLKVTVQKLQGEGLFDPARKKPLPTMPRNIAVLSASGSAALADIMRNIHNRCPLIPVVVMPIPVQGAGAYQTIIERLKLVEQMNFGVCILARGGGSIEDLWNFNEEALARFIADMHVPVVTGVGHETDTTLVDFVADVRCATPTEAAVRVTPLLTDMLVDVENRRGRLGELVSQRLTYEKTNLAHKKASYVLTHPGRLYQQDMLRLEQNTARLNDIGRRLVLREGQLLAQKKQKITTMAMNFSHQEKVKVARKNDRLQHLTDWKVEHEKQHYASSVSRLDLVSPLKILVRGYSIVTHDNKAVSSVTQVHDGDRVSITFSDGTADAVIDQKG